MTFLDAGIDLAARTTSVAGVTTVRVIQGEYKISDDPTVRFLTVLGSCVAACARDPVLGVGGMNHFLLPGLSDGAGYGDVERHGVHAMELLVNALLKKGARPRGLEMKLFGGARTMSNLADIGSMNARFALGFAEREGIEVVGRCLGGDRGRRLEYWPVSGRARRSFLAMREEDRSAPPAPAFGTLELF